MQNTNSQIMSSILASNPLKLESNMDRKKKKSYTYTINRWMVTALDNLARHATFSMNGWCTTIAYISCINVVSCDPFLHHKPDLSKSPLKKFTGKKIPKSQFTSQQKVPKASSASQALHIEAYSLDEANQAILKYKSNNRNSKFLHWEELINCVGIS